ncbi:hypothetical protein [Nocardiopsis sp. MG754419]|uniref:hypothetical protein n=1 Tax=Nocardiopsis sp. MG754419 TaxID=2259865 RepID=UPI001BAC1233|nr:hypothetical protein [Nocardiopsis sp. MG754419]MBR8744205.1 hypothetical protein [Nocardiopsis sp. MG754419]
MNPLLRTLAVLSALELVSVLALLVNLLTVHDATLTRVLGPTHGALYLAVAVTALLGRGLGPRTRVGALLPVLSGPLTMLNVRKETRSA